MAPFEFMCLVPSLYLEEGAPPPVASPVGGRAGVGRRHRPALAPADHEHDDHDEDERHAHRDANDGLRR